MPDPSADLSRFADHLAASAVLRAAAPGTVWLDAARALRGEERSLLFTDPVGTLVARTPGEVGGVLAAVDRAVAAGHYAAGYVAYEAGSGFEDLPARETAGPLAWFGLYRAPRPFITDEATAVVERAAQGLGARVEAPAFGLDRATYRERVAAVRAAIREGEVYQINLTDAVGFRFDGHPLALYRDLRRSQRVPYGAFLNDGERHVLSLSPELFFRRAGAHIETRPMKGTVRRGRTLEEDEALRRRLAADPKSRAENLMIVDLLRNDLSRVCRPGSVQVPALFETERYETVNQMTSTVNGTLRGGVGCLDLFRALFPCGSVTGAPKRRAMRYIEALERAARGIYCGAIGYVAPDERAVFSVAIRTIVLDSGQGRMGTGSGLVWDSDADAEYDECLLKARFLTDRPAPDEAGDFQLVETMRGEEGAVALLELHLDRLRASARYHGFRFDEPEVRRRIGEALPAAGTWRVRLTLARDGDTKVTTAPLVPWAVGRPLRLALTSARVDSTDPALFHKTTRRARYRRAHEEARAWGCDEALLVNEQGEVTEGSRTNVFVRTGRRYVTPPLEAGVLPGVYRRHLLATLPDVEERVLRFGDLLEADAVYVCNAVHGMRAAVLVPAGMDGTGPRKEEPATTGVAGS